jgi:predicted aspartyl protease
MGIGNYHITKIKVLHHYLCKKYFMEGLEDFLLNKGYIKVKLHLTKTNHFEIKVTLNGVKGLFILDTGASNSCVGFEAVETFKLKAKDSEIKAAGAGATDMLTQISKKNMVKIGRWKKDKIALILFNLTHVNTALINHNSKPVDGIIGADLLKKGKAIIDYDTKHLYLKL